jgi:hypothetical protein
MEEKPNSEIKVGSVVYLKSDSNFNLPMIVKSMPNAHSQDEVWLSWIGSQKTMVRGSFPIEALTMKSN